MIESNRRELITVMTFKSMKLLKRLKQAQICEDNSLIIDFDELRAWSPRSADQPIRKIKLDRFRGSIVSILDHLEKLEYIDYDYHTGQAHVTHLGWNATSATFKAAIQFSVRDVIIPLIVTIAATLLIDLLKP